MEALAPVIEAVTDHPYLSSASAVIGCAALVRLARWPSHPHLPPGPRGYPIVGSLFDLPPTRPWEQFAAWGKQYGHVTHTRVFGQDTIILNSSKAAYDLLDKRSAIYSNRPVLVMAGEIVGWNRILGLVPYGPRFREYRKFMSRFVGSRVSMASLAPLQERETAKFLARVMADPGSLVQQLRKTAGAVILMISHGYVVKEHDDPIVDVVEAASDQGSDLLEPGAFLVDMIPLLRYMPEWFPGAGWKAKAKHFADTLTEMADVPHQFVKDQMAAGIAVPSFTSEFLGRKGVTPEAEFNIKWAAASFYAGGADTVVSSANSFYLAVLIHPETQRKAQAEIDRVVGNDRFPTLADMPSLPYVKALVKEVLRWNPVAPLGIPHAVAENDVYEGCFIPKGSTILANIWAILHDPATYTNPMEFNPERFLGDHPERDPRATVFGFGRRICPGLKLAQTSVWLTCAMSLAAFDIEKYVDTFGNVVEPEIHYTDKIVNHPLPFKCTIRPRSEKAAALIASVEL